MSAQRQKVDGVRELLASAQRAAPPSGPGFTERKRDVLNTLLATMSRNSSGAAWSPVIATKTMTPFFSVP